MTTSEHHYCVTWKDRPIHELDPDELHEFVGSLIKSCEWVRLDRDDLLKLHSAVNSLIMDGPFHGLARDDLHDAVGSIMRDHDAAVERARKRSVADMYLLAGRG